LDLQDLGLQVGDSLVEEPVVLPCALEPSLKGLLVLSQLPELILECGVLADQALANIGR